MRHDFYMPAEDEARLFLVDKDVKPATYLGFGASPTSKPGQPNKEQMKKMFEFYFSKFRFSYAFEKERGPTRLGGVYIGITIGSNRENLFRLQNASSDLEMGIALGYPPESINAYVSGKSINQQIAMAEAKKAGVEIPSWMAYVYHCPDELDLVNGKVSRTTQELADKYMKFMQKNNSSLARMVEQNFRLEIERCLPLTWKPNIMGNYDMTFDPALRTTILPLKATKYTFELNDSAPFEVRWPRYLNYAPI